MKQPLIIILCFVFLFSCKKDKKDNIPVTPEPTVTNPTYYTCEGRIGTMDNSSLLSSDGNIVMCGNTFPFICSVLKISKSGLLSWRTDFDPGPSSTAYGITELNKNLFVCGSTDRNYITSKKDVLLAKLNSSGDTIWTKTYGSMENDFGYCVIKTSDNNLLISGHTFQNTGNASDIYLIHSGQHLSLRLNIKVHIILLKLLMVTF